MPFSSLFRVGLAADLDAESRAESRQLRGQLKLVLSDVGLVAGIELGQAIPAVDVVPHVAQQCDALGVWLSEFGVVVEVVCLGEGRGDFNSCLLESYPEFSITPAAQPSSLV